MRRAALLLALFLPLAACQPSLRGGADAPATAENPVIGGTITTTTLDAPAPTDGTATATPATETATATTPAPARAAEAPPSRPASTEAAAAAETPLPEPVATPAPKSEAQLACEDDDGTWARAGDGGGMACIYNTRDGGKRCDSKDDCDGECLARSRSCSPIKPLFGCNAVLMDNGAEVTLCLE